MQVNRVSCLFLLVSLLAPATASCADEPAKGEAQTEKAKARQTARKKAKQETPPPPAPTIESVAYGDRKSVV